MCQNQKTQKKLSLECLEAYFHQGIKSSQNRQIGAEVEVLGVCAKTGKAIPYEGSWGIQAVLAKLCESFGYQPIYEQDKIIALKRDDLMVTLEPGGQLELSAPPVKTVGGVEKQLQSFFCELKQLKSFFPQVHWLAYGIQPFSTIEDISWVPKARYDVMSEHFNQHGSLSHHMMKRTATNQVSFDYTSERDAMEMLRVTLAVSSVATAVFANSPFSGGRVTGFQTERLHIWNHTDPERTGLIAEFLQPGKTFKDYLNYVLDTTLLFIVRNDEWLGICDRTFRDYLRDGWNGHEATLADFELHLSTLFPEVRLKHYVEVRGIDGQRTDLIPTVSAFWKGLLYDATSREKALALLGNLSPDERQALHTGIEEQGLTYVLRGRSLSGYAQELWQLTIQGLARQKQNSEENEQIYLERFYEASEGLTKTPADQFLQWYGGKSNAAVSEVIDFLRL